MLDVNRKKYIILITHHASRITHHASEDGMFMNEKLTLTDILEGVKTLTPEERTILEKELVIMRLSKEFKNISNKFKEKLGSKDGVDSV